MYNIKKNLYNKLLCRLLNIKLLGIIIFIFIIGSMDLKKIWEILQNCSWSLVSLAFILQFTTLIAKSMRWGLLINTAEVNFVPLRQVIYLYLVSAYFGIITPGKIGEMWKAAVVGRKYNINFYTALGVSILDRGMDVYFYLIFGCVSFLLLKAYILPMWLFYLSIIIFILPLILLHSRIRQEIIKLIHITKFAKRFSTKYENFTFGVDASLKSLYSPVGLAACIITIMSVGVLVLQFWILTKAIGINYSWTAAALTLSMVKLANSLPISFLGLGTRDAVLIFIFKEYSISASAAIGISLLMLIVGHLGIAFIGLAVSLTVSKED